MHTRDATGRKVSLLNDDANGYEVAPRHQSLNFRPYSSPTTTSSSPNTPELLRSDSYDSQMSNDPVSPLTPSVDYPFPQGALYSKGHEYGLDASAAKRPVYMDASQPTSFEDDSSGGSSSADRPNKRYPCRYRDTHGCEKTFTTSGHASRHSKIHTAEKAVQCTYPGCQKKFTRADNMKQHLETHYKDKSRSSTSHRGSTKPSVLVDSRRNSYSRRSITRETCHWDLDQQQPLPSPNDVNAASWSMHGDQLSLVSRPMGANSGLDALAMAVACQEGG